MIFRTFFTLSFLSVGLCFAQSPTRLTTDLLEHTDRVFLDGYPSGIALSELGSAVERYQLTEIRNAQPYLGWVVNSDRQNTRQTAYRILLASSPEGLAKDEADLWDSGRTESDNSVAVCYNGKPLQPSTVYYWKVKTWDNHGMESGFSQVRSFITAARLDGETARYPLQVSDEYPVKINALGEGHTLIDFGKDAFGRLKLTLTSDKENDTVTIRLGESVKDGQIDRTPPGTVRYAEYRLPLMAGTHTYTVKIRPDKRNTDVKANVSAVKPMLMPDYTGEALPFRYCELENYRPTPTPVQVVRQTVHYPFNETAAVFHSSDSVLNQVWELCKYSVKATSFAGVYVDGDRERIPYEADALINQLCHYAVDREFTIARYSHEYLILHPTWPTEWILQSVLMAWTDYLYTGNRVSLQRFYDDLKAKSLTGLKESNGLISTRTGKLTPPVLQSIHFMGEAISDIVDWPQKGILGLGKNEPGEADGFVFTDYNTVVNAYHYEALRLVSLIADALGHPADQTQYANEAQRVKEQINRLLLDPKKGYYKDGIGTDHSSVHANMFPLAFGIAPAKYTKQISDFVRTRGLACSVYGSQFLLDAVYNGHDAAYGLQLLASTDERSWYNMIRVGSTISLEAWDNKYKPNQDWNHIWGAAAGNLISRKLMGIEPIEPGFRKIRIKPQPATLRHAEIKTPSIRGDIHVSFDNQPGEKFTLEVEVPANSTAEVWLPKLSPKYKLTIDDVSQKGTVDGDFVKTGIGSGKHVFVIEKK
ncbi:MAG: family 78 glycoside hydrolase catalytic domain [Tannerella sp.]|nr:family 78 glycoside hydrolase catalytic domain [Tannerella sp.]